MSARREEESRSCRGCGYWDPLGYDDAPDLDPAEVVHSNLEALRNQIRLELRESQRNFAADMDRRLEEALNADFAMAAARKRQATSANMMRELAVWSNKDDVANIKSSQKHTASGSVKYTPLRTEPSGAEPNPSQQQWTTQWLEQADSGELDIYTCLGLSDMCSMTADTRRICMKAIAVTLMQVLVPFCLLNAEIELGVQLGPAEDDLGFRLTGFTLYGYAVYRMYNGASDACRTNLLNLMFQYKNVSFGNWFPLLFGELSNFFTAAVLVVALYSIFTTQTQPPDLILNAVAVNFLADCDGDFVDTAMKEEAVANFKEFTQNLWVDAHANVADPSVETRLVKVIRRTVNLVLVTGALGCICFLSVPGHSTGIVDILPGRKESLVNTTLVKLG